MSKENKYEFYSAFFRIFISFHLVKKIYLSWNYRELLFSPNSFYENYLTGFLSYFKNDFYFNIFYFLYLILIVLFFFGLGKNLVALFLYVFYLVLQNLCPSILNGGDNLLKFCMFYLIFIDSYKYFSIKKSSELSHENENLKNLISNLAGLSICIHFCLVYFISAFNKIHADVWFNGVATYYILSLERFRGSTINLDLIKNGFIVVITTYGTIFIELFYPLLVWFSKTKKIMILLAISLHLSIYFLMMLYDFQIIFVFVQGFFISNNTWMSLYKECTENDNKFKIYVDGWCKVCMRFKSLINKVDVMKIIEIKDIRNQEDIDNKKLKYMYSLRSDGKEFYGFDSLFEINKRLILLWLFLPIMYLLKITYLGNYFYNELSVKRRILPLNCDDKCNIL